MTTTPTYTRCTLNAFAAARRLDPARLRELRIHDAADGLRLPCLDEHGKATGVMRVRQWIETAHPTTWIGKPMLFGLQVLRRARERGELVLVEGESDQLTLREHGIPALGVPGSTMTRYIEARHGDGISRLFVVCEPGKGGAQFVSGVRSRLRGIGWTGDFKVVDLHIALGVKDPSELHVRDPELFDEHWQAAISAARPFVESATNTGSLIPPKLNLRDLREVRFERVQWFEANVIPRAELTLVNGDGGIGKTTAMLDLIARASAGRPMANGLQHDRPLRCLIIAEEDRHGLLRARLDVAGANHDNIRLVESVGEESEYLTFPRHARALHGAIVSGSWDVVMIDALLNHLDDDVNASRPQEMRKALRPLVDVAHDAGATVIAIRHIGKGAGPATTRGFGSAEARNLCRSELTVGQHPDKDSHPALVVIALSKANLSPDWSATMAFRLASVDVADDDGVPTTIARVDWLQAPPTISADELLEHRDGAERSRIAAAADWLRDALATGLRRADDVCAEGVRAGHSQSTLYRARRPAGVVSALRGFPAKAHWSLSEAQDSQVFHSGEFEKPGDAHAALDEVRV